MPAREARKRGPRTAYGGGELTELIRGILEAPPRLGEGYRKVLAQLPARGIRTSRARVLCLMRRANLLAQTPGGNTHGPKAHDGTITTDLPDLMWGTGGTATLTGESQATIFIAVDHCTQESIGIQSALQGTRFEALEPIRQGIREHYGSPTSQVASGLVLHHDNGSQYTSTYFQAEMRFLGIESSPAHVHKPEGHGVAARFIRTLKEQLPWVRHFETVDMLERDRQAFKQRYNQQWLVSKHDHRTPQQARALLALEPAARCARYRLRNQAIQATSARTLRASHHSHVLSPRGTPASCPNHPTCPWPPL